MKKNILVTISDDASASYSLRFVRSIFDDFCDVELTLMYVTPMSASWQATDPGAVPDASELQKMNRVKKSKGQATLNSASEWMRDIAGCSLDNVKTKIVPSRKGTVREIIDESRKGLYDCTVLGRKAYTWFEELFEDSVSHGLLWRDIDFPIWICKRPPHEPRKDVLLCVDGSEPSLRMADHVGYMLQGQERHSITLAHVAEKRLDFGGEVDKMFSRATDLLRENGISEERIEYKVMRSDNVARAIMRENGDGRYAAIALGKRGNKPGAMDTFFPSSLSIRLLRLLDETALWISK